MMWSTFRIDVTKEGDVFTVAANWGEERFACIVSKEELPRAIHLIKRTLALLDRYGESILDRSGMPYQAYLSSCNLRRFPHLTFKIYKRRWRGLLTLDSA